MVCAAPLEPVCVGAGEVSVKTPHCTLSPVYVSVRDSSVGPVVPLRVKPEPKEEYSVQVAAVVEARLQDITAVLFFLKKKLASVSELIWPCDGKKKREDSQTYNRFSNVPEYLKVLGPSAKVKGRGPDISQSSVSGQKIVYVVATLSYNPPACE